METNYLNLTNKLDQEFIKNKILQSESKELIKTPDVFEIENKNHHLLFSPLLGRIYMLSDKDFSDYINNNQTDSLIKNNLFLPDDVNLYPPKIKETKLLSFPLGIGLTTECNLECEYCYAFAGKKMFEIELDFIKKSLDDIALKYRQISILFIGLGEPTLAINKIKEIVDYARKKSNNVKFAIQTNGIVNDKDLDYLIKNNFNIVISCDGPRNIQNVQRPLKNKGPSSHLVERIIKKLVEQNKNVLVRSSISKDYVDKQIEILEYFHNLGIKRLRFEPIRAEGRGRVQKEQIPDFKTFFDNFLKALEIAEEYKIHLTNMRFNFNVKEIFCLPHYYLIPDGLISSCYQAYSTNRDVLIYGEYNKDKKEIMIDQKKLNYLKDRTINNLKECQECFLKWTCAGDCQIEVLRNTNNLYKPDNNKCKVYRNFIKKYLIYKIEKELIKNKPHLEIKNNSLYYNQFFNKLKLHKSKNNEAIKGNPYILIDLNKTNLDLLLKQIISNKKKRLNKPTVHLLDFCLTKDKLNEYGIGLFINFLDLLKKNKIWFKIVKPLPECIFSEKYNSIIEDYVTKFGLASPKPILDPQNDSFLILNQLDSTKQGEHAGIIDNISNNPFLSKLITKEEYLFYKKILNDKKLNTAIQRGVISAKRLFENDYLIEPHVHLEVKPKVYNSKIMSNTSISINFKFLFKKYLNKNMDQILEFIESMVTHEACHVYMGQVNNSKSRSYLNHVFAEGLATFSEPIHMSQHYSYLNQMELWFNYLDKIIANKVDEKLLKEICSNKQLLKHAEDYSKFINQIDKERLIKKIFVNRNGPFYHLGYFMWKTIYEFYGNKQFSELIKMSEIDFFVHYNHAAYTINRNIKKYKSLLLNLERKPYMFSNKPDQIKLCDYNCLPCIYRIRKKCNSLF